MSEKQGFGSSILPLATIMNELGVNKSTITGQIFISIFEILEENLDKGINWTELNKILESKHPDFHPKTINGCVWKLIQKFPDKVHKPEKGVFKLKQ